MCCNGIVQIFIKNNMPSSVGPAAYIDCDANGGRMSCRILDMYAHNRILAAHSLRSQSNGVDSIDAARAFSLWLPRGRISAFLDRSAAVSTDVATPTPTSSGGQAFSP